VGRKEIDTEAVLDAWIQEGPGRLPAAIQGLDLRSREAQLLQVNFAGCAFLGCESTANISALAAAAGCIVYPNTMQLPYKPFRNSLYTPTELLAGLNVSDPASYKTTPDWATYLTYADPETSRPIETSLDEVLARRIHDFSISDCLEEHLGQFGDSVVAIMGGHDTERTHPSYAHIVNLTRRLTREKFLIVSGGGPGIMEAANLGAFLAPYPDGIAAPSIEALKVAPKYSDPLWLTSAWKLREALIQEHGPGGDSVGVPTWFYGHEPPNAFAAKIAKYFENSVREDGLVAIGTGGIVFSEGNAGTVQEIFQDTTQNYYRIDGTSRSGRKSAMVLLNKLYWDPPSDPARWPKDAKPVRPLLDMLAKKKKFDDYVLYIDADQTDEIVDFIKEHPPVP
jgi:predicted Rossmann-fold nucleotide-binding protein